MRPKPVDIATAVLSSMHGAVSFSHLKKRANKQEVSEYQSLEHFTTHGTAVPLCKGKSSIFLEADERLIEVNSEGLCFLRGQFEAHLGAHRITLDTRRLNADPYGVLVPSKADNRVFNFIRNGDRVEAFRGSYVIGAISFRCVGRFVATQKSVSPSALTRLGALALLDSPILALTGEQTRPVKSGVKTPPAPGFTLVEMADAGGITYEQVWHRSGTFLIKLKDEYVIFGVDDGSYFGCSIPRRVKTIPQAYDALIPPEARGRKYRRQGEWFAVPTKGWAVPKIEDCILSAGSTSWIDLPVESNDSNRHTLSFGDGSGELRVDKNGRVYAKDAWLSHHEHPEIRLKGWYFLVKNAAVRSFSENGVD